MKWKLLWAGWFVVLVIGGFAVIETAALNTPDGISLSQTVANLSYAWPPIVFMFGLTIGILVSHFWWPWVPKQKRETCAVCGKTILLERK
jgi:hypothetical protein